MFLVAQLCNRLADAYVGLAGHACKEGSKEREQYISSALLYVERAYEGMFHFFASVLLFSPFLVLPLAAASFPLHCTYFTCPSLPPERDGRWQDVSKITILTTTIAYTRIEDFNGTLSAIAKKATLYGYRGETALEEEMEGLYAHVVRSSEERLGELLGKEV